jgi:hypothetical protein
MVGSVTRNDETSRSLRRGATHAIRPRGQRAEHLQAARADGGSRAPSGVP